MEFLDFGALSKENTQYRMRLGGSDSGPALDFAFKFSNLPTQKLIVGFHGAIDRENRTLPVFQGFTDDFENEAHQLQIADPSLRKNESLTLAWYAGDQDCDTQSFLRLFLEGICSFLKVTQTIYYGTSAGGFAALYFSFFNNDSLAIVCNSQTHLNLAQPNRERYALSCWPSFENWKQISQTVTTNLIELYKQQEIQHRVIYLQNSTDIFHLYSLLPFMAALKEENAKNVFFECSFEGRHGHIHYLKQ